MDGGDIGLLVAYIILIIFSAFFSASETAYSVVNRVRLKTRAADGHKRSIGILKLTDNYDRLLSTFLVGNNLVNIVLTTVGTILFEHLMSADIGMSAVVSTAVTTALVLIFGEVTPKSIAMDKAEGICIGFYPFILLFYYIFTPLTCLFALWKKLLKKVFKLSRVESVTEDELKSYVETAASGGEINEHEKELIRSAIEFDDLDVYDVMTPRVNVIAVEENETREEIAAKFREYEYSRMPVYVGTVDSIIGILHEKDLFLRSKPGEFNLKEYITSSVCVSRNMKISDALRLLQKSKVHMAVVVDEYGGTSGIITMEDIIEELVGEIWDEHDEVEVLLKRIDDNHYIVSGTENLDSMFEALGVNTKEEFESTTVGGFVTEHLGKIPETGESFTFENLEVLVTKATVKKVVEVKVTTPRIWTDDDLPKVDEEE